jgi:RND family efflux transporter MFP subunit
MMRVATLIGASAIALVSILAARMYHRPEPTQDQPAAGMTVGSDYVQLAADAPQWAIVQARAPDPAEPRWTEPLPARVVFDESRTSRLGAPLAGRVSAVLVERGQTVKAGAALFTVASPSLAELEAAVKLAEVERETADKNFKRTQEAVKAQVAPGKDLVAAEQKLKQADVALQLAREKRAALHVTGSGGAAAFTVTAPRDGVVVERNVAVGQTVSPDTGSLMAIADLSTVWVVADIFGTHVNGLAPGTKVKVVIGNGADGDRDAVIDQISSIVDPDRHGVPVRIKLDNREGSLRPNAYVQVRLFDPTPTIAMLPASAVMSDGQKSFVYVEKPKGTFKRHDIEVGSVISTGPCAQRNAGLCVPVTSGLAPSDSVAVQGGLLLDNQIALQQ